MVIANIAVQMITNPRIVGRRIVFVEEERKIVVARKATSSMKCFAKIFHEIREKETL